MSDKLTKQQIIDDLSATIAEATGRELQLRKELAEAREALELITNETYADEWALALDKIQNIARKALEASK